MQQPESWNHNEARQSTTTRFGFRTSHSRTLASSKQRASRPRLPHRTRQGAHVSKLDAVLIACAAKIRWGCTHVVLGTAVHSADVCSCCSRQMSRAALRNAVVTTALDRRTTQYRDAPQHRLSMTIYLGQLRGRRPFALRVVTLQTSLHLPIELLVGSYIHETSGSKGLKHVRRSRTRCCRGSAADAFLSLRHLLGRRCGELSEIPKPYVTQPGCGTGSEPFSPNILQACIHRLLHTHVATGIAFARCRVWQ